MKFSILKRWRAVDPAWRFTITLFLVARIALSAWASIISAVFPLSVSNLDLHGEPVVTAFDLRTSERAVYSRVLDGTELHFRSSYPNLTDEETHTLWDLSGRAVLGERSGAQLTASAYSAEEVFPYRGVAPAQSALLAPWQRFDANWYLAIAERGYRDDASTVYFPVYPFLTALIGKGLLGNELLGAILISNSALVCALFLFYQMALELSDESGAKGATAFLILFPTAFFLLAPYSESLFISFALAAMRAGQRARWGRAGAWGALAALTRLQGALMIVPLAYLAWKQAAIARDTSSVAALRSFASVVMPVFLIPFATFGFLAYTNISMFNAYTSELHARFVMPWDNTLAAFSVILDGKANLMDILNLVATLFFGGMVLLVWRRLPREYGLFSAAMLLVPLFRMTTEQPLVSMTRYALVIFPAFILLGKWTANAWVRRAGVFLLAPLQMFLSAQFFMWGWVA